LAGAHGRRSFLDEIRAFQPKHQKCRRMPRGGIARRGSRLCRRELTARTRSDTANTFAGIAQRKSRSVVSCRCGFNLLPGSWVVAGSFLAAHQTDCIRGVRKSCLQATSAILGQKPSLSVVLTYASSPSKHNSGDDREGRPTEAHDGPPLLGG
jgi:hypothetical protein